MTPSEEGSHKSRASPWGVRDSCPTLGTPAFGTCSKRQAPKISGSENQWCLHPGDSEGCRELKCCSSRAWAENHSPWGPMEKQQLEKCQMIYEGDTFAYLKAFAGGAGVCLNSFCRQRYQWAPFFAVPVLSQCLAKASKYIQSIQGMLVYHLALVARRGSVAFLGSTGL